MVSDWHLRNPDRVKELNKKWREENKDYDIKRQAAWRANNQDHIKKYRKQYTKARLSLYATHNRNRRAKLKKLEGSHTLFDIANLILAQNGLCNGCKAVLVRYDVDHIIPVSRGGSNWPSNLQILCQKCNRSKHDKTMEEWLEYQRKTRN